MPSGHTAEMPVQTASLALFAKSRAVPLGMGLLLALMGASRLAVGAHHPTDLLAAMALGALGGLFCQRLAPVLAPRLQRYFAKEGR